MEPENDASSLDTQHMAYRARDLVQQSQKEMAEMRSLIEQSQQSIAKSLARLRRQPEDQILLAMPLTSKIHTVFVGDHPIRFRLETQTRSGTVDGSERECTYICEQCSKAVATFVGIPGETPIPADVLASLEEHGQKHSPST